MKLNQTCPKCKQKTLDVIENNSEICNNVYCDYVKQLNKY